VQHVGIVTVKASGTSGKILRYDPNEPYILAAPAAESIIIRTGTTAGASKISFRDYGNTERAFISDIGDLTAQAGNFDHLHVPSVIYSVAGFSALNLVNTTYANDGTTGVGIDFINDTTVANIGARITTIRVGGSDQAHLAFSTYGTDTFALSERMRITTTGTVGIGTTAPTALLDVNSDIMRLRTAKTPSHTGAGNVGDMCWDATYFYVCYAANHWLRAPWGAHW
jgi:hypothetical protein